MAHNVDRLLNLTLFDCFGFRYTEHSLLGIKFLLRAADYRPKYNVQIRQVLIDTRPTEYPNDRLVADSEELKLSYWKVLLDLSDTLDRAELDDLHRLAHQYYLEMPGQDELMGELISFLDQNRRNSRSVAKLQRRPFILSSFEEFRGYECEDDNVNEVGIIIKSGGPSARTAREEPQGTVLGLEFWHHSPTSLNAIILASGDYEAFWCELTTPGLTTPKLDLWKHIQHPLWSETETANYLDGLVEHRKRVRPHLDWLMNQLFIHDRPAGHQEQILADLISMVEKQVGAYNANAISVPFIFEPTRFEISRGWEAADEYVGEVGIFVERGGPEALFTKDCVVCLYAALWSEFPQSKITRGCNHALDMCISCLQLGMDSQLDDRSLVIVCPYEDCPSELDLDDIKKWSTDEIFMRQV